MPDSSDRPTHWPHRVRSMTRRGRLAAGLSALIAVSGGSVALAGAGHVSPPPPAAHSSAPRLAGKANATGSLSFSHPRFAHGKLLANGNATWSLTTGASMHVRLKGSRKARRRVPKALLDFLSARLYVKGTLTRFVDPGHKDPVVLRGLAGVRSLRHRKVTACVRFGGSDNVARGRSSQTVTLLGATGAAARLRVTLTLPARTLEVPLTKQSKSVAVKYATRSRRAIPRSCRALIRQAGR